MLHFSLCESVHFICGLHYIFILEGLVYVSISTKFLIYTYIQICSNK